VPRIQGARGRIDKGGFNAARARRPWANLGKLRPPVRCPRSPAAHSHERAAVAAPLER
ncbi:MAG: hypothetical protein AVDCRST_MAG26-4338, partial [uncultured Chloroflexia bacterium]